MVLLSARAFDLPASFAAIAAQLFAGLFCLAILTFLAVGSILLRRQIIFVETTGNGGSLIAVSSNKYGRELAQLNPNDIEVRIRF
jgi:hypothetical protein